MTTATDVFKVAGAIIASVGGAGVILLALAGWLGKVWAARILEEDRAKYQSELERLEAELEARHKALQGEIDKTIHVHRLHFAAEDLLELIMRRYARASMMLTSEPTGRGLGKAAWDTAAVTALLDRLLPEAGVGVHWRRLSLAGLPDAEIARVHAKATALRARRVGAGRSSARQGWT